MEQAGGSFLRSFAMSLFPEVALAQTAMGEIEGRPAPVSRRQCIGGANAGNLCNQNSDCPGSSCQPTNIFNVTVAVRFNASAAQLTQIQNAFSGASQVLFDATDGQAQFGQVSIFNNSTGSNGHFWINSAGGCSADTGSWGSYSGGNVSIGVGAATGANGPSCIAHEFVHLTYDARDEYEARVAGCGALNGSAMCPDPTQGPNSTAAEACLMECCGRIGSELCWGQAVADNLAAGNHDAGNLTEQSVCRATRSCWDQVGWSWPNTHLVPAGAPDPGTGGQVHTPVVFVQPPSNARLVMVLDRSGSMSLDTPTRLAQLQTAALDVVDMAENGVELGIVSFAGTASDDKTVTALGANRNAWTTPVNNLTATGATNVGDGLQHAYDMIIAAGGVTGSTGVILMTDGVNNRPSGMAATDLQNKIDLLLMNNIPVWVTCTGDDLGLDSQCAEIASGTNGSYVDSSDAADLPERFVGFYEQIAGRSPTKSVRGSAKGTDEPLAFLVEPGARVATFTVQWTDPNTEAVVLVLDPSGQTLQTLDIKQGRYLRVLKPAPGIWNVRIDFSGSFPADEEYVVKTYVDNPRVNALAALRHPVIQPGDPFEICSQPILEVPLNGLSISGHVETPAGNRIPIFLFDDGGLQSSSLDELADDGKYCATLTDTQERGAYVFHLNVVAKGAAAVVHEHPGIEFIAPEVVDFERLIELSGTVVDRPRKQSTELWNFEGKAEGGRIAATINGCLVAISTEPGQTAEEVAEKFAAAINENECLKAQGITATATGGIVSVSGLDIEVSDTIITDQGIRHETIPTLPVQDFATAVRCGDSLTEVIFVQGADTLPKTAASAVFRSQQGEALDAKSVELTPNSTTSVLFKGEKGLEVGHVETVVSPGVVVSEIIRLTVPGVGELPPIGVPPSPACERPVVALKKNAELDTGVALANTTGENASCDWSIYSGTEGSLVGMGNTSVPPLGQVQFFPLNDPSLPKLSLPFEGNIQYECSAPVHPFSLFQRQQDGALFSNAAGCLSESPAP